jgi:regulatory protein
VTGAGEPADEEEALAVAVRALRHRDRSAAELEARLARHGFAGDVRVAALARLGAAGYLDDDRFAEHRAAALATRGAGNASIAADLDAHGVGADVAARAIEALTPESERAAAVVEQRGASARTLRFLAARGFSEESLEALIAEARDARIR